MSSSVKYLVTTNGTLIDDRWVRLFKCLDFHVAVSVEYPLASHDRRRITKSGAPTHEKVLHSLSLLKEAGINHDILWILSDEVMNQNISIMEIIDKLTKIENSHPWSFPTKVVLDNGKNLSFNREELLRSWCHEFFQEYTDYPPPFLGIEKLVFHLDSISFCKPGKGMQTILPNGYIYPCQYSVSKEYQIGDVCSGLYSNRTQDSGLDVCENCSLVGFCSISGP